ALRLRRHGDRIRLREGNSPASGVGRAVQQGGADRQVQRGNWAKVRLGVAMLPRQRHPRKLTKFVQCENGEFVPGTAVSWRKNCGIRECSAEIKFVNIATVLSRIPHVKTRSRGALAVARHCCSIGSSSLLIQGLPRYASSTSPESISRSPQTLAASED